MEQEQVEIEVNHNMIIQVYLVTRIYLLKVYSL